MKRLVTIEILQKSQRTRPRKWIPVFAFILFLIGALGTGFYALLLFPDLEITQTIIGLFPAEPIENFGLITSWYEMLFLFILPLGLLVWNFIALIVTIKTCNFRHGYWLVGWILLVAYIAFFLFTGFWMLIYFAAALRDFILPKIPAEVYQILLTVNYYGTLGYSAAFALYMFFLLFYNVNYPAKYEEIYELRKQRLRAYRTADERIAYNKRFYRDYKKGNWISMMLDLHFKSLEEGSTAPMREDAFEFLVYYTQLCDDTIRSAVLHQYASEGRYLECRNVFHQVMAEADTIKRGATIKVPTYQPPERAGRLVREKPGLPPAILPPIENNDPDHESPKVRTYNPDDIR